MIGVLAEIKGGGRGTATAMQKTARDGFWNGIRKSLALMERHHKRKEWVAKSGGRLATQDADPVRLTVRTGSLKRSYGSRLDKMKMIGSYGSDLVYAPIHEYGNPSRGVRARPGLDRTINATKSRIEKLCADMTVERM